MALWMKAAEQKTKATKAKNIKANAREIPASVRSIARRIRRRRIAIALLPSYSHALPEKTIHMEQIAVGSKQPRGTRLVQILISYLPLKKKNTAVNE